MSPTLFNGLEINRMARVSFSNFIDGSDRIIDIFSTQYKRSADTDIRGPYNANRHSSFVELVLVVDNKVYKSLGENLKKVHSHCKDIANIMNAVSRTF